MNRSLIAPSPDTGLLIALGTASRAMSDDAAPVSRDPLESPLLSTALFGGVLFVASLVKLVQALLRVVWSESPAPQASDAGEVGLFMLVFAVGAGGTVAWARRLVRRLGSRLGSWRAKNLVSGGVAACWYAGGCYVIFGRDGGGGIIWVTGFTFAGVWFAVTSGLNEVFSD